MNGKTEFYFSHWLRLSVAFKKSLAKQKLAFFFQNHVKGLDVYILTLMSLSHTEKGLSVFCPHPNPPNS